MTATTAPYSIKAFDRTARRAIHVVAPSKVRAVKIAKRYEALSYMGKVRVLDAKGGVIFGEPTAQECAVCPFTLLLND